jgi:hypothetical protein
MVLQSKTINSEMMIQQECVQKANTLHPEYISKYSHQEFQIPFKNLKKLVSGDFAGNRRKTVAIVLSKKVGSTSCINFNRDTSYLLVSPYIQNWEYFINPPQK